MMMRLTSTETVGSLGNDHLVGEYLSKSAAVKKPML